MIASHHFVGRCEEIDSFESLLARLDRGWGGLLVISGNAGIGKTALAQKFVDLAEDRGANAFWSAFPEAAECPPYWGWLGICRQLTTLGRADEARTLCEIMTQSKPGTSQAIVLQRLTNLLDDLSCRKPLALVFDDIQHADLASARLLEAIASDVSHRPLLIVATFRDGENQPSVPGRRGKVPPLAMQPQAQRIVLRGVDELECAQLCSEISGWTPEPRISRRLHRQTEGNPLFLRQIVQSLVDQGHIVDGTANLPPRLTVPEGISEAIGMRFARTSVSCRRTLELAAILGRNFDVQVLKKLDPDFDPQSLDEGARLGLVRPVGAAMGRWQFTHALMREVLYDNIPPMQRLRAHADAAAAIEQTLGIDDPNALSALAYHAFEGQIFVGARRVIELARKAARHAMSVAAYDDAVSQFRLALDCFDIPGVPDGADRIDVALELADAQRLSGDNVASIESCREAMRMARGLEDWQRYTRAALLYEEARWQPGLPSEEIAAGLQLALEHTDAIDERDIPRLHFNLARALQKQGNFERAKRYAHKAIELARKGGRPADLRDAIEHGCQAFYNCGDTREERRALTFEALEIARSLDDDYRLAGSLISYGYNLGVKGETVQLHKLSEELQALAHRLQQPHFLYVSQCWSTALALLAGDFDRATASARSALTLGRRITGTNAAGPYSMQMFMIQRERGVLDEYTRTIRQIGREIGDNAWGPGYALILAETGDLEQAHAILDKLGDRGQVSIRNDDMRMISLAMFAEAAWLTGHQGIAARLFERMLPDSGYATISGPVALVFGPVDRSLGQLQSCLQNHDEARNFFERALEQARQWNSPPTLTRTACDYCKALIRDGSPGAIRRARELQARHGDSAGTLGMLSIAKGFSQVAAELRDLASTHGFDQLTAREVEVLREISRGASNAEIADRLDISLATVATHVRNILAKTNSRNRTAASAFARQAGLVATGDT